MTTKKENKTEEPKSSKADSVKAVAWLIEAAFRGFVGYMLLAHFRHNYVAVAASVYSLATAALIVGTHFVKAHK
jgi:hypothetical protein